MTYKQRDPRNKAEHQKQANELLRDVQSYKDKLRQQYYDGVAYDYKSNGTSPHPPKDRKIRPGTENPNGICSSCRNGLRKVGDRIYHPKHSIPAGELCPVGTAVEPVGSQDSLYRWLIGNGYYDDWRTKTVYDDWRTKTVYDDGVEFDVPEWAFFPTVDLESWSD